MEITSFVLGMLTIVLVTLAAATVVGLLKIVKLNKQLNDLTLRLEHNTYNIYRNIQTHLESIWRQFDTAGRDVTTVEKTIMNQIESIDREHLKHEEDLHREIDETKRYIDSRIDKVVASGTIKEPKRQILNG